MEAPKTAISNEGEIYTLNRAARRRRPKKLRTIIVDYVHVPLNKLTKSTHKIKKQGAKNAKRNDYRQRAAKRARKAN